MSILLILSLFVIWLAWTPGTAVFVDPRLGVMLLLGGLAAIVLVARVLNRRAMQSPGFDDFNHAVQRFNWRMMIARFAIPAWFAAGVFAFGWGSTVHRLLGPADKTWLQLPGVLLGLLPPLAAWTGLWWSQFEIDRALREQNLLDRFNHDMPVFAPSPFRPYFTNRLRTQILFTLVPLLLILLLHDIAAIGLRQIAMAPLGHRFGLRWPMSDSIESATSLLSAGLVFLLSPLLLKRVLHTQRLADSPLRQRLEKMCSDAGLRCRDILLWRTQNNLGNAAVMGLIAPLRYVMLSDLLLSTLSDAQIEAVFAHELGHVKHRHLSWFLAFFAGIAGILYALGDLADRLLSPHLPQGQWLDLSSGVVTGTIILTAFGMLSRRFERQADVYAARLIEPTPGPAVGPVGSQVFASALEQIARVNNISIVAPNWTHGSIAKRMRFIRQLGRSATAAELFDRQSRRLRWMLVIALIVAAGMTVWTLLR